MVEVMEGFRVLEVAQFTFVPAAGAILADWGADVIKVEHPVQLGMEWDRIAELKELGAIA